MGRLKKFIGESNSEIVNYLIKSGFKRDTFVCGNNYGYQRAFSVDERLYYTWIHCDLENLKLNIYKEYECGGEVVSYNCDIPAHLIENDYVDEFVNWLDDECEYYL